MKDSLFLEQISGLNSVLEKNFKAEVLKEEEEDNSFEIYI